MWWMKFVLMDKAGDPPAGGPTPAESAKALADATAALTAMQARIDALEKAAKPGEPAKPKPDDPDLQEKARLEAEAKATKATEAKAIESALRFSLGSKDWVKTNAALLPKDIGGIFEAADKENYGSAIEKDAAIKTSLMQSFFAIQANLDLLTGPQKSGLDEWLKLTKNVRQEKAQAMYDTVFEPTFEMLKRVRKAEQLGKEAHGHGTGSDGEKAYTDKMKKLSRQHYLGEKPNA